MISDQDENRTFAKGKRGSVKRTTEKKAPEGYFLFEVSGSSGRTFLPGVPN